MRGNNTLVLNCATVVEALQEYFDKRMKPSIKITSISPVNGAAAEFRVLVSERQEPLRPATLDRDDARAA